MKICPPALAIMLLSGCNLMPTFELETGEIPEQWRYADNSAQQNAIDPQWWRNFGSAELNQLIGQALTYNNDLAAAKQRIEQARAQAKIAASALLPSVGIDGRFGSTHNESGATQNKSLDLSVAYEVDLWGANRGKRDAGQARMLSEIFARDALQLVIMAEVSQGYFDLLAIAERKRIASEFLQNVNDVLDIVNARFLAGAVSALDLAQQQTERANAQANLDLVSQQQALAENTLAILLGRPPLDFSVASGQFSELATPAIPSQQPASLLQRRPDLRQIEMQLQAANLDVGIALTKFYPSLQLNLDTVLANPQPAGLALSIAAGLAQPLFQGGRLQGGLTNAKARYAELLEIYQQTLLNAFKEVEDAAAVRTNSSRRWQALDEAVAHAREAYQISHDRYRVGAIDYQTLLNTQRTLLTAQTSAVQARLDVLRAMVQLYKALGGGWQGP